MARKHTPDDTLYMEPLKHEAAIKSEPWTVPATLPEKVEEALVEKANKSYYDYAENKKSSYAGYKIADATSPMPYQVSAGQISAADYANKCFHCGGGNASYFALHKIHGIGYWRCCTDILSTGEVINKKTGGDVINFKKAKTTNKCPNCDKTMYAKYQKGILFHQCCYMVTYKKDENGAYVPNPKTGEPQIIVIPNGNGVKLIPTGKLCLHRQDEKAFYHTNSNQACPICSSANYPVTVSLQGMKKGEIRYYWSCCFKICEGNTHVIPKAENATKIPVSQVGLVNWNADSPHDHGCPNCDKGVVGQTEKGRLVWTCCYTPCETCYVPHAYLKGDKCPGCKECPNTCSCLFCAEDKKKAKSLCKHCNKCNGHCVCKICSYCKMPTPEDKYCEHCKACKTVVAHSNHCSCVKCSKCGKEWVNSNKSYDWCPNCNGCSEHCGHDNDKLPKIKGDIKSVGWSRRGQSVTLKAHDVQYELFQSVSPHTAMATFYLLDYMEINHDIHCDDPELETSFLVIRDEVVAAKRQLVERLDPIFQLYVDIAVGGELRHHPALRAQGLHGDRSYAWREWLSIREQIGPEALMDGVEVFRDMGRGYGGRKWAAAAQLLYRRVTNQIPDWLFVDRVFNMQHNGGSLLNKVSWAENDDSKRTQFRWEYITMIGNAHSANPPKLDVLLVNTDDKTEALFKDWVRFKNRLLVRSRQPVMVIPNWRSKVHKGDGRHTLKTSVGTFILHNYMDWHRQFFMSKITSPEGFVVSGSWHCPKCKREEYSLAFNQEGDYYWSCCFQKTEKDDLVKLPDRPKGKCPVCKHKGLVFQVFDHESEQWYWKCCFKVEDGQIVPKNAAVAKMLEKNAESKINCSGCGKFASNKYVHPACGGSTSHGCCKCPIEGDLQAIMDGNTHYCPKCGSGGLPSTDDSLVYNADGEDFEVWSCCWAVLHGKQIVLRSELKPVGKPEYTAAEPWFYGGNSHQQTCPKCKLSAHDINVYRSEKGIKDWENVKLRLIPKALGFHINVHAWPCCMSVFDGVVVWNHTGEPVTMDEFVKDPGTYKQMKYEPKKDKPTEPKDEPTGFEPVHDPELVKKMSKMLDEVYKSNESYTTSNNIYWTSAFTKSTYKG